MKHLKLFVILSVTLFSVSQYLNSAEYRAYSLRVAQERLDAFQGKSPSNEILFLGGITNISGLVYDQRNSDIIIIGKADSKRSELTLDDFVVALRTRVVHAKWPSVNLEYREETDNAGTLNILDVNFKGGIKDTQFGNDMFEADYKLKQISMGLIDSGLTNMETYWNIIVDKAKKEPAINFDISRKFLFLPVLFGVNVSNGIIAMDRAKLYFFTEAIPVNSDENDTEDVSNLPYKKQYFAKNRISSDENAIADVSNLQNVGEYAFFQKQNIKLDEIGKSHPSVLRLQGLTELTGLAKGIGEISPGPDLSYWLNKYQPKDVTTVKKTNALKKEEAFKAPVNGKTIQCSCKLSGELQLMAITLNLKEGETKELKEVVLNSRPDQKTLSWSFEFDKWVIPAEYTEALKIDDVAKLFAYAVSMERKDLYNEAIVTYGKILELIPDLDWPFNNRAKLYKRLGEFNQAVADYTMALEINPKFAEAYNNRGITNARKNRFGRATTDFNRALEINPWLVGAYNNRGLLYQYGREYDMAITDYTKALEIVPNYAQAYYNRGLAYDYKGQTEQAVDNYKKALEINPKFVDAYFNLANLFEAVGNNKEAIETYRGFLKYVSPQDIYYKMSVMNKIKRLEKEAKVNIR